MTPKPLRTQQDNQAPTLEIQLIRMELALGTSQGYNLVNAMEVVMKREQFEGILKAEGWERDRFGHYHKTCRWRTQQADSPEVVVHECKYRIKLQDRSCCIEVQIRHEATEYSHAKNEWVRVGGDYYSKIVQLDDGRIRMGAYFFGRRKQA